MASPDFELQGAIVARLKADSAVAALIAGRIYDQPPDPVTFPYFTVGEAQFIRDDASCAPGGKIYLTMHAWSRAVGFPEVKRIAAAIEQSLHMAPITLPTNRLTALMHSQTRVFRDPDGETSHAVISFVANVHVPAV